MVLAALFQDRESVEDGSPRPILVVVYHYMYQPEWPVDDYEPPMMPDEKGYNSPKNAEQDARPEM